MALTPDAPFPKAPANVIRSKDWNDLVTEVQRLDTAKVDRAGDTVAGGLSVRGLVGLGTLGAGAGSTDRLTVQPFSKAGGPWRLGVRDDAGSAFLDTRFGSGLVLSLSSSGNVGLGTPSPVNRLDVAGDVALSGKHAFRGSDPWLRLNQDGAFPAGTHTPKLFAPGSLNVGGVNGWADPGGGNAWIAGNLGLGTATPVNRLDVAGDVALSGKHAFRGSDPWLRLNQDGAFAAGTHTPKLFAPGSLNVGGVNGWSDPGASNVWVGGDMTVWGAVRLGAGDRPVYIGGNQTGVFIQFHDDLWLSDPQDGTIWLRNSDDSNWGTLVGNFRGNHTGFSSRNFKRDIEPLAPAALDRVAAEALDLPVVTFRYLADGDDARGELGVIAEDCPDYLVDDTGLQVKLLSYLAMLHATVQSLAGRLARAEARQAGGGS